MHGDQRSPCTRKPAQSLAFCDLAVLDCHNIDVRDILGAFLTRGSLFDERDIAVDAFDLDVPKGLLNGLGIRFSGGLDSGDDSLDAVIATEALGQSGEIMAALLPFRDEFDRHVRIGRDLREPGREEQQVIAAVRGTASLSDELVWRGRSFLFVFS